MSEFPIIDQSQWFNQMILNQTGFVPIQTMDELYKYPQIQLTSVDYPTTCNRYYYDYPIQQSINGFEINFDLNINNAYADAITVFIGSSNVTEIQEGSTFGGYNIEFQVFNDNGVYLRGPDGEVCASLLDM